MKKIAVILSNFWEPEIVFVNRTAKSLWFRKETFDTNENSKMNYKTYISVPRAFRQLFIWEES